MPIKRASYLTLKNLKVMATLNDKGICYLPMCYKCKKWILNQIVIVKSYGYKRFICLKCACEFFGKSYVIAKLEKRIQRLKLSKINRPKNLKELYKQAYNTIKYNSIKC